METIEKGEQKSRSSSLKKAAQSFGGFLSGMVMPNIGAFIAWGLITALFIKTGWMPNDNLSKLVSPMVSYMLPMLIAYQGGKLVYDVRGGVVGVIATMGMIVGTSIPMFLGAMIMGPLGGYLIKKFDKLVEGKIPMGFEMLVNNFSAGILGGILAILAYVAAGPVVAGISTGLGAIALSITKKGLLPLIALVVEPAKILFLNNAVNHGVFTPLGIEQVQSLGKSVFFLLEPDPGPGLGILLAYCLYGKGSAKSSAPGAVIIQFLGGIHEIYFPYVLMKPILVLAVMAGGVCADLTFVTLHAGLVAAASPGSIIAVMAMCPKGGHLPVLAGVAVGAVVSFLVASIILRRDKLSKQTTDDFQEAQNKIKEMKKESKNQAVNTADNQNNEVKEISNINLIVFACDAGMGSSAMGESILKKELKNKNIQGIKVEHYSVDNIPKTANVVFVQESLSERARKCVPEATIITVKNFLDRSRYIEFMEKIKNN